MHFSRQHFESIRSNIFYEIVEWVVVKEEERERKKRVQNSNKINSTFCECKKNVNAMWN
jgi:hypothetical protein